MNLILFVIGHPKLPLYREYDPFEYDPFEIIQKEIHFIRTLHIDEIQTSLRLPSIKPKPIEIRKEFPETWLFENLEFSR